MKRFIQGIVNGFGTVFKILEQTLIIGCSYERKVLETNLIIGCSYWQVTSVDHEQSVAIGFVGC